MTTPPKIPAWITQSERVPGEPLSRHPGWMPVDPDRPILNPFYATSLRVALREAIIAFHEKCAEAEAKHDYACRMDALAEERLTRAEAAEAECERLRKEKAEDVKYITQLRAAKDHLEDKLR